MSCYNCPFFVFNANRALGRYLRSLSPIKSISDNSNQDLSLNGILEGKRRKLCARMFYETLVTFSKLHKLDALYLIWRKVPKFQLETSNLLRLKELVFKIAEE